MMQPELRESLVLGNTSARITTAQVSTFEAKANTAASHLKNPEHASMSWTSSAGVGWTTILSATSTCVYLGIHVYAATY